MYVTQMQRGVETDGWKMRIVLMKDRHVIHGFSLGYMRTKQISRVMRENNGV